MSIAAPVRQHVSPLVLRQHTHLRRMREDSARQIRQAFAQARDQAQPHIAQFAAAYGADLARRRRDDEHATVPLVWLAGSLALLVGPVTRAIGQAALAVQAATISTQSKALIDGEVAGYERVQAATHGRAQHAPATPRDRFGVSGYNGQPLSHFYAPLAAQAWQKAQKAAYAGAASGQDSDRIHDAIDGVFSSAASYALLVDETETMLGWRWSLSDTYVANSNLLVGWLWAALGPDPCPACEVNNGVIFPLDADMDSHPRCWCEQVPIAASDAASY